MQLLSMAFQVQDVVGHFNKFLTNSLVYLNYQYVHYNLTSDNIKLDDLSCAHNIEDFVAAN
jgi:bacterioferritin (cytochrome b1)